MNYIITAEQNKLIAKQLKLNEMLFREKKNILNMSKSTLIHKYWNKNSYDIALLARDNTEMKLAMRRQIKDVESFTFTLDEMDVLLTLLESVVKLARYLEVEIRTLQKTVKNVMQVIEHEVSSHHLEHIITYKVEKIDQTLDVILQVIKEYDNTIDVLNGLERKA